MENETKDNKELVELFIPRGYANEEPNLVIGVNGVNYVLPKGKTSKVPKHIAEEYRRSVKAQEAYYKTSEALAAQAEQK